MTVPTIRVPLPHATRTVLRLSALLLATPLGADAQGAPPSRTWEFRIASGSFMPTGDQRQDLRSAPLTAAQLSWKPRPSLAVTGTFGWARTRDLRAADAPLVDAFTADLGLESHGRPWHVRGASTFAPFVGAGAGSRSYDHRDGRASATHNVAGYGAAGGELGLHRVAVRIELRNYVSGYRPLVGRGTSATRNDLVAMLAVRFVRRPAPR